MGLIKKKKTDKKEPTKEIRTDEARPLYSPERRKADVDIEEMLLKIDDDKISNLSKKLKNKLSADEYNEIIDDINKIDKKRKERIEKSKKIKGKEDKSEKGNIKKVDVDKIMELFYPPEQRIPNFEEEDKSEKENIKKGDVDKIMKLFYLPEQRIPNFEEDDKSEKGNIKKVDVDKIMDLLI